MRDWNQPCVVIDVDQTLCPLRSSETAYDDLIPYPDVVGQLQEYRDAGWYIIIHTGRQMRTHECNQGRINAKTLPALVKWLDRWDIPYDEIWPNKPWAGFNGVYVDDHTITPKDFTTLTWEQIQSKVAQQQRR